LKKAAFRKTADEWIFQLKHAEYGVDRMAAIEELRWMVDSARVNAALSAAAVDDRFGDVRLQAVFALDDAKRTDVSEILMKTYGDSDARVRAASMSGLKNYHSAAVLELLRHAFEKDSSYAVASGALSSLMKADSVNAKKYAVSGLKRDSFRESIRLAALRGLADVHDDEAFKLVGEETRYGRSREVRLTALDLLARKWKEREAVLPIAVKMTSDPSIHMRRAAAEVLGNSGSEQALAPLRRLSDTESDARLVKIARDGIEKITKTQQNSNAH
jgi:HEAT repeat protein